ncbi:hypothetical protein [Halovenus salina]|uniref:DUF4352 domain-containing protein n=1 Tax=Halovenus salina TaxID=1510225 RepID=A0ABD5W578_9EURY|nr:hypothetical protein [Halovenus salina]
MPSRRAYLVTLVAGVAGCAGNSADTDSSPTAASDTTPTETPTPHPAVSVEASAVQYSYRHIEQVDWNGIQPADGQFVFVAVDASEAESAPERTAFSLVTADGSHRPIETENRQPLDLDVSEGLDTQMDTQSWELLTFEVPARLDTTPSLRLERGADSWEWRLDTEKATAPPPAWEWSASAPETVAPDETFDITIAAENVGDGPGTFRGAVNFSYPTYRPKGFDIVPDADESGETTVSASAEGAEPGTTLEYGVRTPAGRSTVTVTVEDESKEAASD